MKKILFGSAAAICAVVGFSAFKSAKTTTSVYYFDIQTNGKTGAALLDNIDVRFRSQIKPTGANPCSSTSHNWCVVGISTANLTQVNFTKLATQGGLNQGITQQPIASVVYTKHA